MNKMDCPVCLTENCGAYLFTECGHSLCPDCIIRLKASTQNIYMNCPSCRAPITKAPVVIQAFADKMADGMVRQMAAHFAMWYAPASVTAHAPALPRDFDYNQIQDPRFAESLVRNPPIQPPIQNRDQFVRIIDDQDAHLIEAARREYTTYAFRGENIERQWSDVSSFTVQNTTFAIENLNVNKDAMIPVSSEWAFVPFREGPVVFRVSNHTCYERGRGGSGSTARNHRRIIISIEPNSSFHLPIALIETKVQDAYPNMRLHSEIRNRLRAGLSLAVHSGLWENEYIITDTYNETFKIACRGVWTDGVSRVGCRWHIVA